MMQPFPIPSDEINTHGMRCDFGKHKGELYTRLPVSYLKWMVNSNHTRRNIAEAELKRRGTVTPSLDLSGHAIDRASLRLRDWFEQRSDKDQGLHAWLEEKAAEALKSGEEKEPGKKFLNGVAFVFEMDGVWPVLKSIYPAGKRDEVPGESILFRKTKERFSQLTEDERSQIAREYCGGCFRKDPGCHCQNDE